MLAKVKNVFTVLAAVLTFGFGIVPSTFAGDSSFARRDRLFFGNDLLSFLLLDELLEDQFDRDRFDRFDRDRFDRFDRDRFDRFDRFDRDRFDRD